MKLKLVIPMLFLASYIYVSDADAKIIDVVDAEGNPSCAQADVQAAIDAADYGDTVSVPACVAGECVWTSGIDLTKDIKIIGAGIDATVLTLGFNDDIAGEALFKFIPDATSRDNLDSLSDAHTFEISGITFTGNSRMRNKFGVWIYNLNTPPIKRVKIHHNKFTSIHRAVQVKGYVHGVFYSNTLLDTNGSYPEGVGHAAFANDRMTLGSGAGWYIEDNTFSFTGGGGGVCGAGNNGGGYVVRYNTLTGSLPAGETYVETHGNQLSYIYGPQITEVYGNNFAITGLGCATKVRGGKNIYLNNIAATNGGLLLWEEYSDLATSDTNPIGRCPENQGVSRQTCTDSCICQKIHDSYFINNRASATGTLRTAIVTMDYEHRNNGIVNDPLEIVENIEFFNYVESGFDGTAGVGAGTFENRPTTCTPGVGYWATEQSCTDLTGMVGANPATPILGTLYKCTAPDTWSAYYTPYTYPHPLTQDSIRGDLNADSQINIQDIQACVNHILGTQTYANADVTGDGPVNVLDVQEIVNIILSG